MTNFILLALIVFLPLQFALNIGDNFDLVTTRLMVPIVFLLWLARSMAKKKIFVPLKVEIWFVVSFLFLSSLSLFLGKDASAGYRKLLYFFSIFPIFFVAADVLQEKQWKNRMFLVGIISGSIAALLALFQFLLPFFLGIQKAVKIWEELVPYVLGNSFGNLVAMNSSWLVNIGGVTWMRAFGFFPDPHNFSFFVNLCFFSGLGYFFSQKKNPVKTFIVLSLVLMFASVILSFSRGAYLGLIAGAAFFAVIFLKRSKILGKTLLAIGLAIVFLFALNSSLVSTRLASSFNLKEGSNKERFENWAEAANIVLDYPIAGVGLGNYARMVDPEAAERSSIYAHNLFLDIAVETGIPNAMIFFSLIFVSVWRGIKSKNYLGLGISAGLISFFVHSIFDTALYSPQVLTIFLVLMALELNNIKTSVEGETCSGRKNSNEKSTE